jgi:acyl transferase domain-containing protein/3-hydroxymyristoyl/3-hydroxydecanoyl-(acyl carrier protein) dehydratase
MSGFEPIAIVGRGCWLPGAADSEALIQLVLEKQSGLAASPPPGLWLVDPHRIHGRGPDGSASLVGGYVGDVDLRATLSDLALAERELLPLDVSFHWALAAARQALITIGHEPRRPHPRAALVLGNLSYPTRSLALFAEAILRGTTPRVVSGAVAGTRLAESVEIDPRTRFMSGLPAHLLARALGLGGAAFALDAACASSLYAVKLGCDRLHDRECDLVVAGGVNGTDDLFLHVGFTALGALSPTGQSRPFHREADGLIPSRGAAFVALERLADAQAAGHRVFGVIRAVSVANDGRSQGLLVPSREGQLRTMAAAYPLAGLTPADVSLVECHATGTRRGDETEVLAMRELFRDVTRPVAIGSLKGNLGHLITASGAASLIKILGSFERGTMPPTLHADAPLEALTDAPLRLVTEPEPWTVRPRRAAISSFGFGGNNAHLLLEEPDAAEVSPTRRTPRSQSDDDVAVVAVAAVTGGADDFDAFADLVLGRIEPGTHQVDAIRLDSTTVRFPPNDLRETLPQQLLVLGAAMQIADIITAQNRARTSVLIGMQSDAEVARVGGRLRTSGNPDAFWPPFSPARVLGAMPNVVANRIGSQFDLSGPSYTVSAEEASGLVAAELAMRALAAGEIDAAIVGAVDLCCEPVHRAAAAAVLGEPAEPPGDAAVVMVLKRVADARRAGDRIHAVLSRRAPADVGLSLGTVADAICLSRRFGHAHAASGLLHVAAAIACCERRLRPGSTAPEPWLPNRGVWGARVAVAGLGGRPVEIFVRADAATAAVPTMPASSPRLEVYSATTRAELIERIGAGDPDDGRRGPVRLAIASTGSEDPTRARARAVEALRHAATPEIIAVLEDGTYFAERPVCGEVAFVFTGPAGAYFGMGRDLVQALPQLVDGVQQRFANPRQAAGWIYDPVAALHATPEDKLWASSFLSQVHAELTLGLLGIEPQAVLGLCAGESNALFAMGVWDDLTGMYDALRAHAVFTRELAGEFAAVARSPDGDGVVDWNTWRLLAPVDTVRDALAAESDVHLAIIQAPDDVVICGDAAACRRVVTAIGQARARRTGYDVAFHCPEARSFAETWRALHRRPVRPRAATRFYSHATCSAYEVDSDSVADALTTQAMQTVDFPRLVTRAASDGVRIFIEHGQHAGCSKWIDKILADTPHLAVSLDSYGQSSLGHAVDAVARLVVAGVPLDVASFQRALAGPAPIARQRGALSIPAHAPPVPVTAKADVWSLDHNDDGELMEPPPALAVAAIASRPVVLRPRATAAVSAARDLLASMNAEHRRFLEVQAGAHEQFLASQAWATAVLVGAHAAGAPGPAAAASLLLQPSRASAAVPSIDAHDVSIQIAPVHGTRAPRGPRLERAALEAHASGRVSDAFGPAFRDHDDYARRVRMPEPPLLLADRVTGLEAEPGSMGLGTVWTETNVRDDSWYLHAGRMPAGIVMESGQADLLLISYLGIDRLNRGERVYRLLGCDFTFHHRLPRPGDTLAYDIHVDSHAEHNGVRLFSFHSDAYVGTTRVASWRNAQAGFFTYEELANARGVVWRPEEASPTRAGRCDPPALRTTRASFDRAAVRAFAEGAPRECFGPAFVRTQTHTRTPRIPSDRMLLLDEVTAFDPTGGPWRRGYLRAVLHLDPDRWFFRGHFTNDPCMPGTLMVEMCMQAMAFYLAALGFTATRDGWVFEPTVEEPAHLVCRSQVVPESKELVCEVFVDEVISGPEPTLYAAVLGTVDGQPAMHSPRMALSLRPGWPIDDDVGLLAKLANHRDPAPVAVADGVEFGYRSLVHGALGKHSDAFGALYLGRDGPGFLGHLPAPPYHFMSRVVRIDGRPGAGEAGIEAAVEYDVPLESWYFTRDGNFAMPFAVVLEVAFQPCGWLAFFAGLPLAREEALYFRNLDGRGTFHRVVGPGDGPLRTTTRLTSVATAGGPIIVSYTVSVRLGYEPVLDLETVFGFFDAEALSVQPGLPTSEGRRRALAAASAHRVAIDASATTRASVARIGMLDEVTGVWPDGGAAGLGRARGRQCVDPDAWYFKAHFVRDPVQPGALGLQAMLELLEYFVIHRDPGRPVGPPRFETPALGEPVTWKCRGQVLPENKEVLVDIEITRVVDDERGLFLLADGSLWVDGTRVYEATGLSTRLLDR